MKKLNPFKFVKAREKKLFKFFKLLNLYRNFKSQVQLFCVYRYF